SSGLPRPKASASLATIFSEGWRRPDSRRPIYATEVFTRRATSSCVRSICRRRLLIRSPKLDLVFSIWNLGTAFCYRLLQIDHLIQQRQNINGDFFIVI